MIHDAAHTAAMTAMYLRRVRDLDRPLVHRCPLTRKWIVCPDGVRHNCNRPRKSEEAFGAWSRAMDAACVLVVERREQLDDWFERMTGEPPP